MKLREENSSSLEKVRNISKQEHEKKNWSDMLI